jgi:hypothetical protein
MFGHSSSNSRPDPELPAHGQLLIGDDRDGGAPLPFVLNPGERLEMGYMKVFWSTNPLQLDNLKQSSAFDKKPHEQDELRKWAKDDDEGEDWGVVLLTMVQHAPPLAT